MNRTDIYKTKLGGWPIFAPYIISQRTTKLRDNNDETFVCYAGCIAFSVGLQPT